jgi:hypothetical protein
MANDQNRISRRAMLRKSAMLFASIAAIPLILEKSPAAAQKIAKLNFHYQATPKDGKKCADCAAYVAVPGSAEGACKVVEGPISPSGWCIAFSSK